MSLLDQFTKISGQDPLKRLVDEATSSLEKKLQNSVEDLFLKAMNETGVSKAITNELASRFGDSFMQGAADKYFRTATTAIERLSGTDILSNILPNRGAETTASSVQRVTNAVQNLSGTQDSSILQYPLQIGK